VRFLGKARLPLAVAQVEGIDGLKALIGKEIGPGEWREVRQEDIDVFADLSGDHQWIHVDRERAEREEPVRHDGRARQPDPVDDRRVFRLDPRSLERFALGVNYGWNKVRFRPRSRPAAVCARRPRSSRSRMVGSGWWQVVTRFTVEVEGSDKPCCVADSVGRALVA
jgi:acyl dehydratase